MAGHGAIRVGTSGWIYRHWRGVFYPRDLPVKRWFTCYCKAFATVEINNTFYRLPAAEVFDEWRQQAPAGFVYAVKASRYLTHLKKLKDPADPLDHLLGRARQLGPHLGPVLYQLPPHWHCDVARLDHFSAALPSDLKHVFEFRDPSWYNDEVQALLTARGMSFCIHDLKGDPCPVWVTGPLVYLRFHGPTSVAYAGRYRLAHLRGWAEHIRRFQQAGRDVYVYFNNDDAGHAVTNAWELRELLAPEPMDEPPA